MLDQFSVIKSNLKVAFNAIEFSNSVTLGQIEEVVSLLKDSSLSFNDVKDVFLDIFNRPLLSGEYLQFCFAMTGAVLIYGDHNSGTIPYGKVSYLHNDYSYAAFKKLCPFSDGKPDIETDFNSVLEAVHSGRCKYALVPLYNTRDGLITSLYRLVQKYELKIISSTRVLMSDGNTETEFFLVSSALHMSQGDSNKRLMLSVIHPWDRTVADLLSAMAFCKIGLCSFNSLPIEYTDERCDSVMIFDISEKSVVALECFLQTALPETAATIGYYNYVK